MDKISDELNHDMAQDEVNKNNSMKRRWFMVAMKVGQINIKLCLDTYNSNNKNRRE